MRNVIIIGCIVTLMLGSAISIAGEHEDRALIKAVDVGDFEKVKQLLANGANVNAIIPDDMGVVDYVPLNMAICSKNFNLDIISELLIAGANVKYTGDSHDILTNLVNCRRSSEEKLMEAAELLISFGAKVDTVTDTIGPAYALAEADGLTKLAQLMRSYSEK